MLIFLSLHQSQCATDMMSILKSTPGQKLGVKRKQPVSHGVTVRAEKRRAAYAEYDRKGVRQTAGVAEETTLTGK